MQYTKKKSIFPQTGVLTALIRQNKCISQVTWNFEIGMICWNVFLYGNKKETVYGQIQDFPGKLPKF